MPLVGDRGTRSMASIVPTRITDSRTPGIRKWTGWETAMDTAERVRESKAKRHAKRLGLELHKSRAKKWSMNDWGGYQVRGKMPVLRGRSVLLGANWDLDLGEVEKFLHRYEGELKGKLKRGGAD